MFALLQRRGLYVKPLRLSLIKYPFVVPFYRLVHTNSRVANNRPLLEAINKGRFNDVEAIIRIDDENSKKGTGPAFSAIQYLEAANYAESVLHDRGINYIIWAFAGTLPFIDAPIPALTWFCVVICRSFYVHRRYSNLVTILNNYHDIRYKEK